MWLLEWYAPLRIILTWVSAVTWGWAPGRFWGKAGVSWRSLGSETGLGWGTRAQGAGHQTHLAARGCQDLGGPARTHVPQPFSPARKSGRGRTGRPVFYTYQRDKEKEKVTFAPVDPRAEAEPLTESKACPHFQGSAGQALPGQPPQAPFLHASSPAPQTPPTLGADLAVGWESEAAHTQSEANRRKK